MDNLEEKSLTDEEIIAAWVPVTTTSSGSLCFNPLLDLPLKPYAGMDKNRLWEMFIYRLAQSEAQVILQSSEVWTKSRERNVIASVLPALTHSEAGALSEEQSVPWNGSEEAPLRPSDLAAGVIIWLWRNGLRYEAVSIFERIWRTVRICQESSPKLCISWPVESALEGFRVAAYRDWDDENHAEFVGLFRERFIDEEIERAVESISRQ